MDCTHHQIKYLICIYVYSLLHLVLIIILCVYSVVPPLLLAPFATSVKQQKNIIALSQEGVKEIKNTTPTKKKKCTQDSPKKINCNLI